MYSPSHDYVSAIIDEIALEGLDGITIEALWIRLGDRPTFTCALNDKSKVFFWNLIRRLRNIEMYELPEPRKPLVIFNRYNLIDPELGMLLEPSFIPEDIYPHHPIDDQKKKVRGSCSSYDKRKNVTKVARTLSLDDALERWGSKLVLVGSQEARNTALMGLNVNPSVEMTIMQYCILERIGRSRYLGEVTQGKVSLQVVGEEPKALFYHRKYLMKYKLVVKQVHHQKSGTQNITGSLLHLPRFRVERKPKSLYFMERIIEILKTRPNCIAEYEEIRRELRISNSLKKLFKTYEFQRFVKTDVQLPYRALYPAASVSEWKHKANDKEKKIRVIQLINPDMDVRELWTRDDELDEEEDPTLGLLDQSELLLDRSILSQAYDVIEKAGPEGLSQMELSAKMGVSKLHSRTLCRNLLKKDAVSMFMNDVGRQRVCRYISKKFKEGKMSTEFKREKERMLNLVGLKKKRKKTLKMESKPRIKSSLPVKTQKIDENEKATSEGREGEEGDGPKAKKPRMDIPESEKVAPVQELISQDKPADDKNAISVEHKIEAQVLEVMDSTPKIRPNQGSFMEDLLKKNSKKTDTPNITYRLLRRANLIIEAVRTHKVIDDLTKLMKLINEEEETEGYNVKIDKMSLLRLLLKLSKDGHLKVIKIVLKGGTKEKMLSFVCEPHISTDHPTIRSAIEQAKMKFFIYDKEKVIKLCSEAKEKENTMFSSEAINRSMNELKSMSGKDKIKSIDFAYDIRIGKKYGYAPKFIRMQIMHQYFFYLIYGYTGSENLDQEAAKKNLKQKDESITDNILAETSTIYSETLDWKMFIPPLTKHPGWPDGWAIMCDLLLRMPLSIFVKVVNITFIIPDLETFLQHPVRRHYLVRHLPSQIRNALMVARRYIFSIHEVMQRLCYVGLIQFGPQRLKEKDQVFVYLNHRTTLMDTTTSKPSYHQISDDTTYTEHKYEFRSLADIDKYWYEMWNFCIHTQLGGRMHVTGKDIVLEVLQNKQAMIDAIQPRSPERAPLQDTGEVPGDKRGAAGLDSAFFSHLKRNWNWTNNVSASNSAATNTVPTIKLRVDEQRKARLGSLKTEPLQFVELFQKQHDITAKNRPAPPAKKKSVNRKAEAKKVEVNVAKKKLKKSNIVRRVLPRKKSVVHKPYYDDVDQKALQLMSKLRVEWSPVEDNLLLLCKVASMYMCPIPRKQFITFQMIRDYMHAVCPASHNKTSRACQRRILYVLKNPATSHSVALHLEDVRQDPDIVAQFGDLVQELQTKICNMEEEQEQMLAEKFKLLVKVLQSKFNPKPSDSPKALQTLLPETLSQFRKEYNLLYPSTIKRRGRFQEVKNVVDIYCAVVNAIIFSSLCCAMDKTSYTYQLFQVYQQYPDNLLRSAMAKIRADQMVSLKKSYYMSLKQKTGNYLPVSSSPYQLSISYFHQLQTRYQYEIYHNSYLMAKELCLWYEKHQSSSMDSDPGMETVAVNGGMTAALVELFTKKQISFDVEIPEQIIILDPRVSEKDETYARIVQRYRDILRTYKTGRDCATSSLIFRQQFINLVEPKDVLSNRNAPSCSKDRDGDPELGDADDDFDDFDDTPTSQQSTTAIARAASRLALYMMREELGDSMIGEKQHAHDFFVVNSCKVFCKMMKPTTNVYNEEFPEYASVAKHFAPRREDQSEVDIDSKNDTSLLLNDREHERMDGGCSTGQDNEPNYHDVDVVVNQGTTSMVVMSETMPVSVEAGPGKMQSTEETVPEVMEVVESGSSETQSVKDGVTHDNVLAPMDIVETECSETQSVQGDVTMEDVCVVDAAPEETKSARGSAPQYDATVAMDVVEDEASKMQIVQDEKTVSVGEQLEAGRSKTQSIQDSLTKEGVLVLMDVDESGCSDAKGIQEPVPVGTELRKSGSTEEKDIQSVAQDNMESTLNQGVDAKQATKSSVDNSRPCLSSVKDSDMDTSAHKTKKSGDLPPLVHNFNSVLDDLLPLTRERAKQVFDIICSNVIFSEKDVLTEEEARILFSDAGATDEDWKKAQDIIDFVMTKKEIGATMKELRTNFRKPRCPKSLAEILALLNQSRILNRSGVTSLHYVHHKFMKPWLIHSYKFLRLEREKNPLPADYKPFNYMDLESHESVDKPTGKAHEKIRTWRKRKMLAAAREVERAVQNLNLSQSEKIHIAIRPWVRVDGTVNRRVLDRMLGSVLGYSMYMPGCSLKNVAENFTPALQPFQVRELVEILQMLGCVKLSVVRQTFKTTLFSKPSPVKITPADGTEDESKIMVDPQPDAVLRLGQFIGDKAYATDFLSTVATTDEKEIPVNVQQKAKVRARTSSGTSTKSK